MKTVSQKEKFQAKENTKTFPKFRIISRWVGMMTTPPLTATAEAL